MQIAVAYLSESRSDQHLWRAQVRREHLLDRQRFVDLSGDGCGGFQDDPQLSGSGMPGCPRRRPKAGERKGVNCSRAVTGHTEKDLNITIR